jgi:hypothetical protein
MDAHHFDTLTSRLTSGVSRRRGIAVLAGGAIAALLGHDLSVDAKQHKQHKQRCKPRALQAVCQSNQQCCTKTTGRVCRSNAQGDQCNQTQTVCCLPFGAKGCQEDCDCCEANAFCSDSGVCGRVIIIH